MRGVVAKSLALVQDPCVRPPGVVDPRRVLDSRRGLDLLRGLDSRRGLDPRRVLDPRRGWWRWLIATPPGNREHEPPSTAHVSPYRITPRRRVSVPLRPHEHRDCVLRWSRVRRWVISFLVAAGCFSEAGSTSTSSAEGCEPAVLRACFCDDGSAGEQRCDDQGTGYSDCQCGVATGTATGTDATSEVSSDATSDARPDLGGSDSTTDSGGAACVHRVFVTAASFTGDITPRADALVAADTACTAEASAAGLGGAWVAVLSDSVAPASGRIVLCGDVVIANGGDGSSGDMVAAIDSWWSPDHLVPITRQADGVEVTGTAWTGTRVKGEESPANCGSWTLSGGSFVGTYGLITSNDTTWIANPEDGVCSEARRLYCIELAPT